MKRPSPTLFLGVLLATGCATRPSEEDANKPMFGGTHESRFEITTDRELDLHELAKIAKVIGPYRQLTKAEVRQIETRLRRFIDDLVIEEERRIEAQQRRTPPRRPLSKAEIHAKARSGVLSRLGKDLALPLLTSDNRSVVAFGSIQGEAVEVTSTAYEIDKPASRVKPGAEVTKLDGTKATMVDNAVKR